MNTIESPRPWAGRHWLRAAAVASGLVAAYGLFATGLPVLAEDFGDFSSVTLTGRAWEAFGKGELDRALVFTGKCRELYQKQASEQQKGLSDFLPKEKGHDAWALNDVGTCLFIEGQVHEKAGRKAEAVAAYKTLTGSLGFAQCWDPKGWFWRPAEAAAGRVKQLEFDALLDEKP
jgi:hypothetical protein